MGPFIFHRILNSMKISHCSYTNVDTTIIIKFCTSDGMCVVMPWAKIRDHTSSSGITVGCFSFLHDWPWISPWIKSISNELDISCHVFASQWSGHCDGIANRLWRHQQSVKWASEVREWCVKILVLASFLDLSCRVRNKIKLLFFTRVLFWCLFPSLLRNSGNKHQNNTLVSA